MPDVKVLVPPYASIASVPRGAPPPLGTIVICHAVSPTVVAGPFRVMLERAPWCAPCLVTGPTTGEPDVLAAIHELPGQMAFVSAAPNDDDLLVERTLMAVGSREQPSGGRLAEYVMRRTGRTEFRAELAMLLARGTGPSLVKSLPVRTLRGRLRRFGRLTGHGWKTVGTLCRLGAIVSDDPVEFLAWRAGVEPRTLRTWTRRFLDVTLQEFRKRVGWEWVLEGALRVAGYLTPETSQVAHPLVPDNLIVRMTPLATPAGLRRISRRVVCSAPAVEAPAAPVE